MTVRLADLEMEARAIGRLIGGGLPAGVGFGLLLFDFGEGGNLTWISNGSREEMIKALRDCADKMEAHKDSPPIVVRGTDS